ncbi:MAG: thermosome subunit beta [Thermoplasmatota archaeon]|jgi:thermosome
MMLGNQPIIVLKEGTKREKGKNAQSNNIAAAVAIADTVKSTLGPKGMDKMLVDSSGDIIITNDGATILKEIEVEHPAAKMIVEVAKTQDEECGDGTTTAVILTGELLRQAQNLLDQKIHPTVINFGYKLASKKAVETLEKIASTLKIDDTKTLEQIAITSMASKSARSSKEYLAHIVVEAVTSVLEKENQKIIVDLDNVQIQKKTGASIEQTEMIKGTILDKQRSHQGMPERIKNAKIALINAAFEIKKTEVDAKIQIKDPTQLQMFLDEEERMITHMVDRVKKSGATVVFCEKAIDDIAEHFLAKNGIYAIASVKESDMQKLAKATGARIVANFEDFSASDLGFSGLVEERKIGDEKMTFISECKNPRAVSILLRGGTDHVVDEVERAVHDALSVVKLAVEDQKITAGGGASAAELALCLREYSLTVGGREQMAIEAFAIALEVIPKTLAENAGFDPIDVMLEMRSAHKKGMKYAGVNAETGKTDDMMKAHVVEPLRVSRQQILSASEAARMILRIDDVIASKGSPGGGGPTGYDGEGM